MTTIDKIPTVTMLTSRRATKENTGGCGCESPDNEFEENNVEGCREHIELEVDYAAGDAPCQYLWPRVTRQRSSACGGKRPVSATGENADGCFL